MVEDMKLIDNIQFLKERKTIICGCRDLVRKSSKLCLRAGFEVYAIFSEGIVDDQELKSIVKKDFNEVWLLKDIANYNIIIAESDNEVIDRIVQKFNNMVEAHLYTYFGFYNAIFANLDNKLVNGSDINSISDINYSIEVYDFLSRWLRSIRWVNESAIPVLLYAMPKTGTQAMKKSLIQANIEHTYIHFLNLDTSLSNQFGKYFGSTIDSIGKIVKNYEDIRESYLNIIKRNKIKIITVMREPIARNYSMAFQAIKNWGIGKLAEGKTEFSLAEAIIEYIDDCKTATYDWFEDEINQVFGINIYDYPFDKEKGCQVIREGNIELFVYKLEKSSDIEDELRDFLGVEDFELLRKHESSKEEYRFIYDELKQTIHIPKPLLDCIYGDIRIKHFYSDYEIESFYKKWE